MVETDQKGSGTTAIASPEGARRAPVQSPVGRWIVDVGLDGSDVISPELALVDPQIARSTAAGPTAASTASTATTSRRSTEAARAPRIEAALKRDRAPDSAIETIPRWGRRLRFVWLLVCLVVLAGGVLFLPSSQWTSAGHDRVVGQHPSARGSGGTAGEVPGTTKRRVAARLAARQPHAFGWVSVAKATYYRVRFFRDGRKVFEGLRVQPRIVLPGKWRFNGRRYRLDAGRYRWVVEPGFGSASRKQYGKAVVAADWVAAAPD
jgi:hypothetical protein